MSRSKGLHFENLAQQFLQKKGLKPLAHNYSCRSGEIDLIMRDGTTLCFIEVKYRKNSAFGGTAYSVSRAKQEKIIRSALHYISGHPQYQQSAYRFDVVFIQPATQNGTNEFEWIKSAFDSLGF